MTSYYVEIVLLRLVRWHCYVAADVLRFKGEMVVLRLLRWDCCVQLDMTRSLHWDCYVEIVTSRFLRWCYYLGRFAQTVLHALEVMGPRWAREPFKILPRLGYWISYDNSIWADWEDLKTKLWKAYWANMAKAKIKSWSIRVKNILFCRAVAPHFLYRCVVWPVTKGLVNKIESLQKHMVGLFLDIP